MVRLGFLSSSKRKTILNPSPDSRNHRRSESGQKEIVPNKTMGVYTFICNETGGKWSAKQYSGDLEGSAASTYDLQRNLVNVALTSEGSGVVQSSFSYVTPSSAVFQVIIGGVGGGGGFITGGRAAAPAAAGGGAAAPAEEPPAEEKKKEEEESDEDMGFSLFD